MRRYRPAILVLLALSVAFCCLRVYRTEARAHALKAEEMELSSITYGLFNPDSWRDVLTGIVTRKIEGFQIDDSNRAMLKQQLEEMLGKVIDEVQEVIEKRNKKNGVKGFVRGTLMNAIVDMDDVRSGIPRYADRIIAQLDDPKNREKMKGFVLERVDSLAARTSGTVDYSARDAIMKRHGFTDRQAGIEALRAERAKVEVVRSGYGWTILVLVLTIFGTAILGKHISPLELGVVVLTASVLLITSLWMPMIDIMASISSFNFTLMGEPVVFKDQVLFYESRSILQVIRLLLREKDAGLMLVAVLVFSFSVAIPFMKLITSFIASVRDREPGGRFSRFLVLKSGKWSMADVTVVAMFMAYLGFNGVVNGELRDLREYSEVVHIMTTNQSSLEFGFHLFTGYVLSGLLLSVLIERRKKERG